MTESCQPRPQSHSNLVLILFPAGRVSPQNVLKKFSGFLYNRADHENRASCELCRRRRFEDGAATGNANGIKFIRSFPGCPRTGTGSLWTCQVVPGFTVIAALGQLL
jgi:hypothetical protein